MIKHKKKFGIYHWDTFDNTTILVGEADTVKEATALLRKKYGDRIKSNGADKVDIVNSNGNMVRQYSVG